MKIKTCAIVTIICFLKSSLITKKKKKKKQTCGRVQLANTIRNRGKLTKQ